MRKFKKVSSLMAFAIVFSMIASLIVMPVSASSENIAPTITGVANNTITYTGGEKASDAAAAPEVRGMKGTEVFSYDNGVLSVHRTVDESASGVYFPNLGLKSGKTYKVSADIRRDTEATGGLNARFFVSNISGSKATWENGTNISQNKDNYTFGELLPALTLTNEDEWYTYDRTFTIGVNEEGTAEKGVNFGIKVGANPNALSMDYSIKNIKVVEVTPLTGSAVANGTNAATFTFSNELKSATEADFEVTTTATGAEIPTLTVVPDGKTVEVTMSGYSSSTTYTISAKADGLTDEFGQKLTEAVSVNVTTEAPAVTPPAPGANLAGTITGVENNQIIATGIQQAADNLNVPKWTTVGTGSTYIFADGVVSVTGRTGGRAANGPRLDAVGLESGKTYKISADFRRDSDLSDGTSRVRFVFTDTQPSTNKATLVGGTNINQGEGTEAGMLGETPAQVRNQIDLTNKGEWYTLSSVFTMGVRDTGTKEQGIHIGLKLGQNTNADEYEYSFRNFKIVEVTEFTGTAEADLANGATFTFSNELKSATEADFEVTTTATGAKTPSVSVTKSGKECEVVLSDYTPSTTYTITAKTDGVTDEFDQNLATPVSVSVTTEAGAVPPSGNLLVAAGTDYSFENMAAGAYTGLSGETGVAAAETYTVVSSADAQHGSKMVKIEGAADSVKTMQRFNFIPAAIELGKRYEVSVWVKAVDPLEAQAAVDVYVAPWGQSRLELIKDGSTKVSVTPSGEWQRASIICEAKIRSGNDEKPSTQCHIGVERNPNSTADIYIDNYSICEYVPEFKVSADLASGATFEGPSKDINLTFTEAPVSFTASNVELKKGTTPVTGGVSVSKTSNTEYKIALTGLESGKDYTLKVFGVQDSNGQTADDLVITFSTTAEVVVPPVVGENLAGTITGVVNGEIVATGTLPAAENPVAPSWVTVGAATYAYEDGVIKVTDREAESGVAGPKLHCVGLESGKTYKISADFRRDSDLSVGTSRVRFYLGETQPSTNKVTIVGGTNINQGEGDQVGMKGEIPAQIYHATNNPGGQIDLTNKGEWYTLSAVFTLGVRAEGTKEQGVHIGLKIGQNSNSAEYDYSFRNFKIVEVTPLTGTAAADVEDGATFTFSNELKKAEASDFTVTSTVPGARTPKLNVVQDGKKCTVTLSDYTANTAYTITAIAGGVADEFDQTIAQSVSAEVTTGTKGAVILPGINLLNGKIDYSFENMTVGTYTGDRGENAQTSAEAYSIIESADAKDGSKMLLIEGAADSVATLQRFNQIPDLLVEGYKYEVSVWIKAVDPSETHAAVRAYVSASGISKLEPKGQQYVAITPDGTWQKATVTFTAGIRNEANTGNKFHIGVTRDAACEADIYVDHYEVKRIVDPLKLTSNIENGAVEVTITPTFNLSFTNAPVNFTASNVQLMKGAEQITEGISFTKVDDKNYKIAISNLSTKSDYKLKLVNVADEFDQALENPEIAFSTVATINLVEANGLDWSFENGTTFGHVVSSSWEYESTARLAAVNGTDERVAPTHGSKMLKISNRSTGSTLRIPNLGKDGGVHIEPGKTYKLSMDVRTAPDAKGNLTSEKAKAYFSVTTTATNTITYTPLVVTTVDISSGGWTTITGYVTTTNATPTNPDPSTHAYAGIHIGCTFTGGNDVYIDNIVFKEYFPDFTVATNPEDGGLTSSNVVTYTFSNPVASFTEANVSVSGETAVSVEAVNKVSDTVYTVLLDGVDYDKDYTIEITGVSDTYGQSVSKSISFSTGSGNAADDNNIMNAQAYDFSFEKGMFGLKYDKSNKTLTVVDAASEGITAQHGSKVLKVVNPEPSESIAYSHRVNNVMGGEIGKQYMISVWARTVNPAETVTARLSGTGAYPGFNTVAVSNVKMNSVTLTGEWQQVSAIVELVPNTSGTKESDEGFHFLLLSNGVDIYVDNYQMYEIPTEDLHIVSSTPAQNSDDASINVGKIILNFSETLADGFDPVGKIKLFKGETDVTASLVSDVAVGFGNSSIEITVGELENNTVYRVEAANVVDYLKRTVTESVTFKTAKSVTRSGITLVDGSGNALESETATAGDVAGAQVSVTNTSSANIKNPVLIYTVYNPATNEMEQVGATAFEGIYTPGHPRVLSSALAGLDNKRLALYVVNSNDNITFVGESFVKDFSGSGSDFEQGGIVSDTFVYDIDTDASKITLAGKSEANSEVPVVLVKAGNGAAPANNFYTDVKEALSSSITDADIATKIVHFASAKSDENGYWSITLPVGKDSADDKAYYAITSGGSLVDGFRASKVFVPSEETEEQAEAAINGAANAADLAEAIDDNDYILGLDTANRVYLNYKKDIAAAILAMKGDSLYASDKFTSLADTSTFKSHFEKALAYYTRQVEALDAINGADSDSLKAVLTTYSQGTNVLGSYAGEKLDYATAYATHGYLNVNRLVVDGNYETMSDFIKAFKAAVTTLKAQQADPKPGTPSNPSSPSGPSGSNSGPSMYVPTTKVPQSEVPGADGFTDLGEAAWAEESIQNLVNLGVINGMGDGTFRPNGTVTREQFVKMLLLLLGVEIEGGTSSFADVDNSQWYAPYVAMAYEMGIVNGISATEFGVGQNITRQDIVVMTARACEAAGLDISKKKSVSFEDEAAIADYALNAVKLFASAGIINGVSEGVFAPADNTTRAQVAVILDRLYNM